MKFTFTPINAEDVRTICAWHYKEPYSVYDMDHDVDNTDIETEMLDRRSPHYAVRDEQGVLIGFFGFGSASEVWDNAEPYLYAPGMPEKTISVGLGIRPDLTGNGLGLAFVNAGLDFANKEFAPDFFRLYVMPFNKRAIRVYEQAGFARSGTYMQQYDGGEREFVEMLRPAR